MKSCDRWATLRDLLQRVEDLGIQLFPTDGGTNLGYRPRGARDCFPRLFAELQERRVDLLDLLTQDRPDHPVRDRKTMILYAAGGERLVSERTLLAALPRITWAKVAGGRHVAEFEVAVRLDFWTAVYVEVGRRPAKRGTT